MAASLAPFQDGEMPRAARLAIAILGLVSACTGSKLDSSKTPTPTRSATSPPARAASAFEVANVTATVRFLAGGIGPREATSAAYRAAGTYVEQRFRSFGYSVTRQRFVAPAGVSNFASVQEGETFNVVATPPGFDLSKRHLVVGAHLDTVPQAPGAVDDATGVGIVLELARLASVDPPPVPVVFIAFGAEEARVPNGGLHGSRRYVALLTKRERDAIAGAISIDRVGVGSRVPVCTTGDARSRAFARRIEDAARRAHVPAFSCTNATSDHVSFERAGIPAARIGPDPYAEYHTPRDVPAVLDEAQALRAGTLLWSLLRSGV